MKLISSLLDKNTAALTDMKTKTHIDVGLPPMYEATYVARPTCTYIEVHVHSYVPTTS